MKLNVTNLSNKAMGEIDASDSIFAAPLREDLIQRVVLWQLARRRAGTHKVKGRSEVRGTTHKQFRQKGTGRARRGDGKVAQFRGGGRAFGPVVRDHAHKLPKKLRRLALCSVISEKHRQGQLLILKEDALEAPKTSALYKSLLQFDGLHALIITGENLDKNFNLAARNLPNIVIMPSAGANVYDVVRHKKLILSESAIACLEKRLRS